jgi:hypothetical protein
VRKRIEVIVNMDHAVTTGVSCSSVEAVVDRLDEETEHEVGVGSRGPFTVQPIPNHEERHVMFMSRLKVVDKDGRFVCAGTKESIDAVLPKLELSYIEWLMLKP